MLGTRVAKKVFVLGCERSGSTWISNILDSHPDVEFFMEPFADYASIFPGFPERNLYLSCANYDLMNLVKVQFEKLLGLKYSFCYKRGKFTSLQYIDRFLIGMCKQFAKKLCLRPSLIIDQYELLNLNMLKIPIRRKVKKAATNTIEITKELRLNFKVGVLSGIFPNAKYIVSIRHPGAQITSIIRLFQQGALGELRKSLLSFFEYIRNSKRFEGYMPLIQQCDWENDMETKLVIWWLVNYETLIADLKTYGRDYYIVYHEDISEHPHKITSEVLDFCGLTFGKHVKNYIAFSSENKRNNTQYSSLNTNRDSRNYYKKKIRDVDEDLRKKCEDIFSRYATSTEILTHYGDQ